MDNSLRPFGSLYEALRQLKARYPQNSETISTIQRQIVAKKSTTIADDDANRLCAIADYLGSWEDILKSGTEMLKNEAFVYNEQLYRCVQTHVPQPTYPPNEYTLALYRPIAINALTEESGTADNPFLFVYGMDVYNDKIYSYNGFLWRWIHLDTPACIWPPGTAGVWFWDKIT